MAADAARAVDVGLVVLAALDAWINLDDEATPLMWACAALGSAGLLLRRRFPLAVFLLTLPMLLFMDVGVAPITALYTLAARTRNRPLLAGCALLNAAASTLAWPLTDTFAGDRTWTLIQFVYTLAMAFAPILCGQLMQSRRDVARRLVEVKEVREHERALYAQTVLARERAQLAREMHDVVSHQVSLIAVQAGVLQVATKDPDARDAARTIRTLSVNTLDELRHMVTLLRASGGKETELTPAHPRRPPAADRQQRHRDHPDRRAPARHQHNRPAHRLPHGPGSPHERTQARPRRPRRGTPVARHAALRRHRHQHRPHPPVRRPAQRPARPDRPERTRRTARRRPHRRTHATRRIQDRTTGPHPARLRRRCASIQVSV